jgi:glucose-1-phosphate thymidylyltransferase
MTLNHKGIILAGGTGSRLFPTTISVSKQLMPVFDKPMIYYPLSTLLDADIREILVITTPSDQSAFQNLLGDGSQWGIDLQWAVQDSPDGLAQALIIAEKFLDGHPSILVLGDNLFFGDEFKNAIQKAMEKTSGATIFGYHVSNPSDYGIVGFDENQKAVSLKEKPSKPASNFAVTGIYLYDSSAPQKAKTLVPSPRGELEITALNMLYLDEKSLEVELLGSGTTWLDTGTHRSLLQAAQFVAVLEERQGRRICCPEVIVYEKGWITKEKFRALAEPLIKSGYGQYLLSQL